MQTYWSCIVQIGVGRVPAVQFNVRHGPSAVILEAKRAILLAVGEEGQLRMVRGYKERGAFLSHEHRLRAIGR